MNIEFMYELEYCSGDEMASKLINVNAELEAESIEFDAYNSVGILETQNKDLFTYNCISFIATDPNGKELTIGESETRLIKETAEDKALESAE